MADFKSIKGTITIIGGEGAHTFEFNGAKTPAALKEIPKYAGECIARSLLGADESETLALKTQIRELQAKLDEQILINKSPKHAK